jgi:hypothetical protein
MGRLDCCPKSQEFLDRVPVGEAGARFYGDSVDTLVDDSLPHDHRGLLEGLGDATHLMPPCDDLVRTVVMDPGSIGAQGGLNIHHRGQDFVVDPD